jgi:hypothetical protein
VACFLFDNWRAGVTLINKQLQRADDLNVSLSYSQTVYGWMGRIKEHRNSTWSELAMENWHKSDGKYEVTNYLPECRKFVVRFEQEVGTSCRCDHAALAPLGNDTSRTDHLKRYGVRISI